MELDGLLILLFVLAALGDYLSCLWHQAREAKRVWRITIISMLIEAVNWLPIWLAIMQEDLRIAAVSIVGSGLGTLLGASRLNWEQEEPEVKKPTITTLAAPDAPAVEYTLRQEGPGTVSVLIETSALGVKKP
jgi:hypothetical protein